MITEIAWGERVDVGDNKTTIFISLLLVVGDHATANAGMHGAPEHVDRQRHRSGPELTALQTIERMNPVVQPNADLPQVTALAFPELQRSAAAVRAQLFLGLDADVGNELLEQSQPLGRLQGHVPPILKKKPFIITIGPRCAVLPPP